MYRPGVAVTVEFTMYSSTTGLALSGLSCSATLSKDGAAYAASTNAVTEIGVSGRYRLALTAAEMTVTNGLSLQVTATGALRLDAFLPVQEGLDAQAKLDVNAEADTAVADALKADMSTFDSGAASRSILNALRRLRNKVTRSGATMTVRKEDDSASAWTATLTTDASAQPVTDVDPA